MNNDNVGRIKQIFSKNLNMQQKNQYYYLLASLFLFSSLFYITNLMAEPTSDNDNQVINVYKDQPTFTINLKSNPTTGYKWFLTELNDELITPLKSHFVSDSTTKNLVGAGGIDKWSFKVKSTAFNVPRITYITLNYARPWEKTESAENSSKQIVKIIINPSKTSKEKNK